VPESPAEVTKILVEGRIQTRNYEAKDGSGKRYITEIVIQQLEFGDRGTRRDHQPDSPVRPTTSHEEVAPSKPDTADDDYFGDVPF